MADTVHVLGLGGVGVLVAHALAGLSDRPRLNLLLHRPRDHYPGSLAITRNGDTEYQSNFTIEEYRAGRWFQRPSHGFVQPVMHTQCQEGSPNEIPIRFLLVAVKAHYTVDAIRLVKHRLTKDSTILFLQNGLGVLDELDAELFPNPRERPSYLSGVVTHCIHRKGFLSAVHTSAGKIVLGTSPRIGSAPDACLSVVPATDAGILAGILSRAHTLNASLQNPRELLQQQLIKLATNSIYNPLTALLGCSINVLITSENLQIQAISDALIREISDVIKALPLSGMLSEEDLEAEFSRTKLKRIIRELGLRAGEHTTSMLQDIRNGVATEIMYLNGFFMRWGPMLGVDCPANEMITRMVLETESRVTGRLSECG
ncbi:hypothetical protein ASPFODRAFT_54894 [Aspergillus luchuensis CBS 106.47]|uniref:2-dehydropantoate 2-reductase n=1 Tax=Aspergillus luchuensis (strain CBS 106.47) TaxID=1137211 RepID=A0A1M3SYN6_ASPLC|nr:hypothetical protein ASPFODRAFT_54894 [Aspergillus luchuensis CBS 106.47]